MTASTIALLPPPPPPLEIVMDGVPDGSIPDDGTPDDGVPEAEVPDGAPFGDRDVAFSVLVALSAGDGVELGVCDALAESGVELGVRVALAGAAGHMFVVDSWLNSQPPGAQRAPIAGPDTCPLTHRCALEAVVHQPHEVGSRKGSARPLMTQKSHVASRGHLSSGSPAQ